jgi:hypothetical protein
VHSTRPSNAGSTTRLDEYKRHSSSGEESIYVPTIELLDEEGLQTGPVPVMDDRQFKPASDGLRVVDPSRLDLREESEIVAEILSERPVTHTKNIWTFWDKFV